MAVRSLYSTPLANNTRFPHSHGIPSIPLIPSPESVGIDVSGPSLLSLRRPTVLRPGLLPFIRRSHFRDRTRHRPSSSTTASQPSMETFTGLHSFLSLAWYVFFSTYRPGRSIISIFPFSPPTFISGHLPRHRTPTMARSTPYHSPRLNGGRLVSVFDVVRQQHPIFALMQYLPFCSSPLWNSSELAFLDPPYCRSVDLQFCDRAFYRSPSNPIFMIGHVTGFPCRQPHPSSPWRPSQDSTCSFLSPGMFFARLIIQDAQ